MRMKNWVFGFFVVAFFGLSGCFDNADKADVNTPIKIGYINSYSGLPHFVERGNRAAQMLVDDLNAQGGIKGRQVELIIRDDRAQAGDAITITQELISRDKVHALAGVSFSHISLSIAQLAERYQMPYFAGWCASSKCPEAGGDYLFSVEEYPVRSGKKLARLAAQQTQAKRWAVLGNTTEWTFEISGAFKRELQRLRPDVVFVEDLMYGFGKADGNQAVQALKAQGVEGIFNSLFGKELAGYLRAARAREFMEDVTHIAAYLAPEDMIFLGEEAPEGWYAMGYPEEHLDSAPLHAFIDQYKARYNGQNPGITGLIAVVNLELLFEAFRQAKSLQGPALAQAALSVKAQTPLGEMFYNPTTRQSNFTYWYGQIKIKDGKPYLEPLL